MKQDDTIEYNALGWVKKELDVELKQARQSLEAYIEDGDDGVRLEQCGSHIRQAQGTLQMVELFGAAMLAEEMSELLQAVMDDKVSKKDDAYEALIRAIIQLPDYLEHIQAGNRDVPIVLLPLMNDLRAARGVQLLSENVLFFPDLDKTPSVPTAEVDLPPQPVQDNSKLNRALRHAYQLSLLGWFRDREPEKSLKKMYAVLERLRQTAVRDETSRLWWIAGTLAQALSLEGLESSVAVKQLLGKVDREIRLLIEKGEDELADNVPEDVLKNLLYYLATSETVSEQIKEVKRAFKLSALLPSGQDLEVAEGQVGGLNIEILQTVAEGIREDLTEIKDGLEVFVHSEDKSPESLEPLADRLRKVADTLTMLGMGQARELVLKDEERIREMVSGAVAVSDDALLNVAGVMLSVESALNSFIENRALPQDIEEIEAAAPPEAGRELPEAEYNDLLRAVIRETLAEMSKAKETILEFISDPANIDCMQPVPDLLESIKGAMSMLPMERLVLVIESIQAYVGREVLARREMPVSSKLEALADAITTVEMYLESLEENRGDHIQIIEFGEKSVSDLGYPAGVIPDDEEQLTEILDADEPDVEFISEEEEALTVEMAMPSVQEDDITEEIPHIPGIEEVEDEDVFDIGDLGAGGASKDANYCHRGDGYRPA
jgi:chemosensory pili system protein ChpA (sensor histidine kinase/response regulator)